MGNRRRDARRGTDPGAVIRALRLEQLLREELNSIIDGELGDQRFSGVRITLVELSRDGSRARIWYSMTTTFDAMQVAATHTAFDNASRYLRSCLCDALPLKRFPELSFRHDPALLLDSNQEELA